MRKLAADPGKVLNIDMRVKDPDVILPLVALMAPLFLWMIEVVIGLPVIFEELVKLVMVVFMLRRGVYSLRAVALIGGLFGLSEAALYLFNISLLASFWPLLLRLLLTVPMHGATMVIMFALGKRMGNSGLLGGFVLGTFLHYGFNLILGVILL